MFTFSTEKLISFLDQNLTSLYLNSNCDIKLTIINNLVIDLII